MTKTRRATGFSAHRSVSLPKRATGSLALAGVLLLVMAGCKTRSFSNDVGETRSSLNSISGEFAEKMVKTGSGRYHHLDSYGAFPADTSKDFTCPGVWDSPNGVTSRFTSKPVDYKPESDLSNISSDWSALTGLVNAARADHTANIALIDIIRDRSGTPHFHYMSNGSQDDVFEPWNSSKMLATAAAASRMRGTWGVGLTGSVGGHSLADLVTIQANYDESHGYNSNGISGWMKDLAGRDASTQLFKKWLGRSGESFGGAYGGGSWGNLSAEFSEGKKRVTLTKGTGEVGTNSLSALSMAEFLKRLVMHRENPSTRLKDIEWADVRIILDGPDMSRWFGRMGGMSAGQSVYLYKALGKKAAMDERYAGKWRIRHKLGYGVSEPGSRNAGEFRLLAHVCLPHYTAGSPDLQTAEFVMMVALQTKGTGEEAQQAGDKVLYNIIDSVVKKYTAGVGKSTGVASSGPELNAP